MADKRELESYIRASQYRMEVFREIVDEGPLTPSSLADVTDIRQPHVSRTLQELRERGVIELAVPESQTKGRLYNTTEAGKELWRKLRGVQWQGQLYDIPDRHREIVTKLNDYFGESLLVVGHFDGGNIENYYLSETIKQEVPEDEFSKTAEQLVTEYSHEETNVGGFAGELSCEVQFLTGFIRIVIYDQSGFLAIGLDTDVRSEFPSIVEDCKELLK